LKTIISTGLALLALLTTTAQAQTAGGPAADVGAGQRRAAVCFACHNPDGISKITGTPHLAGQDRAYLEQALRAYRDGRTRQNPTMNAMAGPLSDQDIVNIAAYFSLQARQGGGAAADTCERIRPVGEVVIGAAEPIASAPPTAQRAVTPRSGEAVYRAACVACHGAGVAGAPKFGNAADWAPRLAQGTDSLLLHAVQGFRAMPPRGGCADCSDAEIRAAVDYLTATVP
jgi:cytochrome c5